ncbi:hypothetical protein PMKS-000259 [Pichia membranifaciens]|uniref:SUN domain-containing protein n=1 Tax=Pichia membranifaciens TaxID=4926 RepID=A0A1Q2YBK2_9ASCO|nr:hypothetical protein PMKS-000259 [Pichia membranifaciens]
MVIDEFRELVSDDAYPEENVDDEYGDDDEYDGDYDEKDSVFAKKLSVISGDEEDYNGTEDSNDTGFSGFEKQEFERYTDNPDKHDNQNLPDIFGESKTKSKLDRSHGPFDDADIESDTELDNTHFLYDPPLKYKEKFLMYMLKSSPLLIVGLFLLFVSSFVTKDALVNLKMLNPFTPSSNLSPFLSHKIYLLEEDVKSLRKLEGLGEKMNSIESGFKQLQDHINKLEFSISSKDMIDANQNVVNPLFEKLNDLERKVDTLSKDMTRDIVDKKFLKEMKGQLVKYSGDQVEHANQAKDTKLHKVSSKFYNIANNCRVSLQLTSYPPLSQYKRDKRRKTIQSRIIHGFPDFMKRMLNPGNSQSGNPIVKTLANIKLLSPSNSPRNVLLEHPSLFWQSVSSAMPVYLTVQAPAPIKVHELGIYHSRLPPNMNLVDDAAKADIRKRWFNTAPKNVEFLVRPIATEQRAMKKAMGAFYNQDLKFDISRKVKEDSLVGWVRVGELRYDINSNRAYQPLIWNNEVKLEITKWDITDFMVVIHSNWGDEVVVLDTLRIFQLEDTKSLEYDNPIDTGIYPDGSDNFAEDEVIYLGEEKPLV